MWWCHIQQTWNIVSFGSRLWYFYDAFFCHVGFKCPVLIFIIWKNLFQMFNLCVQQKVTDRNNIRVNCIFYFCFSLSLFHLFAVLDVNDGTPTFFPNVYNISLEESVPRDYVLVRLNCTDNDSGLNAELSYFITGQSSKSLKIVICFPDPWILWSRLPI